MIKQVYTFPNSIFPDVQRITPLVKQNFNMSPFNSAQETSEFGGDRWQMELTFLDLTGDQRAEVSAFFTKMRVGGNFFFMKNHTNPNRGLYGGSAFRIAISSLQGNQLSIFTVQQSETGWAKAGDFISVNSELKMITEDVNTLGNSSVHSVEIWPPLRSTLSSGTVLRPPIQ